ncbi:hypothetical protein D3OALGA1CA_4497 [Olavius algarvensis associated proteobacterium Delta 3]|nr:hypothetical protein D3OALGA1CA_4497 [Olavius algarvensis associated proteobacterium Delta 3]
MSIQYTTLILIFFLSDVEPCQWRHPPPRRRREWGERVIR